MDRLRLGRSDRYAGFDGRRWIGYGLAMPPDIRHTLRRLDTVTRLGVAGGIVAACIGIVADSEWLGLAGGIVAAIAVIIPNWTALELMHYDAAQCDKPLPPFTPDFWRRALPKVETTLELPRAEASGERIGTTIH